MASQMQSYFTTLAKELDIDLKSTIVKPDNARTIKGSFDETLLESSASELDENASRWMESSCSSDVSLSVPGRRGSFGTTYAASSVKDAGRKETYREPTMCATVQCLKEVPTDNQGLLSDELPMSPPRVRKFHEEMLAESSNACEEIPRLKGFRFATDEKYSVSNKIALVKEGLIQYPKVFKDDNSTSMGWSEDSREDTSSHAGMQKTAFVRRENQPNFEKNLESLNTNPRKITSIQRTCGKGDTLTHWSRT